MHPGPLAPAQFWLRYLLTNIRDQRCQAELRIYFHLPSIESLILWVFSESKFEQGQLHEEDRVENCLVEGLQVVEKLYCND